MNRVYESTRGNVTGYTGKQAIALGMVPGGGLFVPMEIPQLNWEDLRGSDYPKLARRLIGLFLPDFEPAVLDEAAGVYHIGVFDQVNPAPLKEVGAYGVLELWHGPTAAFKDMALQVLPHLLTASLSEEPGKEVLILTATSGDTGKAALEGFRNVPGTQMVVFYPHGGVSPVQERQMTTTDGMNTYVAAVEGNFDECQSAVKRIFASERLQQRLQKKHMAFSSANSINWGRLLPQIAYYYWAYLQAVEQGRVKPGEALNIAVPTGNFGNILAGYYAKQMGLPIARLICASNKNKVLSDFFTTGVYDSKRPFYLTISPSMDILISSNFERFLYEMSGRDAEKIRAWYGDLANMGSFQVDARTLVRSQETIYAGWADEGQVLSKIRQNFVEYHYVFDPHTAVAAKVCEDYRRVTGDTRFTVILATASPFKFADNVYRGIKGEAPQGEWEALEQLSALTGWEIPEGLQGLQARPERPAALCRPDEMEALLEKLFSF